MPSELAHFYSRTRDARKVIVVDLGFLGDTIHTIPALWELKSAYSGAALHVLTSPVGAEALQLAPCVERAWEVELAPGKRSLAQQLQVLQKLRRERFDVAFNFSGADRTLFMTALIGAPQRVAYPGGRQHFWNSLLIRNWIPSMDPDLVVYEKRRQMLSPCGIKPGPARFDLRIPDAAANWAAELVPMKALHISPNASHFTREWPLEHHARLLKLLWEKVPDLPVIATGSPKDRERQRLEKLASLVQDPRLTILNQSLTIARLAAVLQRCSLHLGPDSGALHLAVALGLPTISFLREQGAYKSFMPVGPRHRVLLMPCRCPDYRVAPCQALGYSECFASIDPSQVAQFICEALTAPR